MIQEIKTQCVDMVIVLETYTDDGRYGKRCRYYYTGPDGLGFKTKKQARQFKSPFKKYIKKNLGSKTEINGEIEIGILDTFCTYKYMGAGPSYSCPNIEVKNIL